VIYFIQTRRCSMKCSECTVLGGDIRPYRIGKGRSAKVLNFHPACFKEWFEYHYENGGVHG